MSASPVRSAKTLGLVGLDEIVVRWSAIARAVSSRLIDVYATIVLTDAEEEWPVKTGRSLAGLAEITSATAGDVYTANVFRAAITGSAPYTAKIMVRGVPQWATLVVGPAKSIRAMPFAQAIAAAIAAHGGGNG